MGSNPIHPTKIEESRPQSRHDAQIVRECSPKQNTFTEGFEKNSVGAHNLMICERVVCLVEMKTQSWHG